MRRSIRFDLRVQLLLIPLRRHRDFLLHALLQVRVRLDVRSVHKHDLRRQVPRPGHFLQNPAEHALDDFRRKAMAERIADRRKVRKTLRHRIAQKPAIRHVHFRIPHGLTQRMDSEQRQAEANRSSLERFAFLRADSGLRPHAAPGNHAHGAGDIRPFAQACLAVCIMRNSPGASVICSNMPK